MLQSLWDYVNWCRLEMFSSMWLEDVQDQARILHSGYTALSTRFQQKYWFQYSDCQTEVRMNKWKFGKMLYQKMWNRHIEHFDISAGDTTRYMVIESIFSNIEAPLVLTSMPVLRVCACWAILTCCSVAAENILRCRCIQCFIWHLWGFPRPKCRFPSPNDRLWI